MPFNFIYYKNSFCITPGNLILCQKHLNVIWCYFLEVHWRLEMLLFVHWNLYSWNQNIDNVKLLLWYNFVIEANEKKLVSFFEKYLCLVLKLIYSFICFGFFPLKIKNSSLTLFGSFCLQLISLDITPQRFFLALTFNIYFCCYFWHLFTLLSKFNNCFPPNFLARNAFRPFVVSFIFSWWAILFIVCINCNEDISSNRDVFFKNDGTQMPIFFVLLRHI